MGAAIILAAAFLFTGQGPAGQLPAPPRPALEYTGTPLRLPLNCTNEGMIAAGLTCTEESPCNVFLELASVEALGARLIATGNLHTSSSTLASILLVSPDGGKTWSEPHERIPLAALDQIQFFDFETGWVNGQVLHPLPGDPFFLLTNDGGATWRRRPMFGETRIGVIERFWFDSRTHGWLWLDRTQSGETGSEYERYESMTGGESWSVREVTSKPIPVTGPAAVKREPGWRVRVDSKLRAFAIEQRTEKGWRRLAAFLVDVGECRPQATPPPQPPVETTTPPDSPLPKAKDR
ncbi:MAG: hypothetical protein ABFD89_11710 [Bryobacteraceae bacterium]